MDPSRLYEQPFTDYNPTGLDGLFSDPEAEDILRILATVNGNGGWAGPAGTRSYG